MEAMAYFEILYLTSLYSNKKQINRYKENINKKVFYYLAETNTKKIKISIEHIGYKWLSFNDMIKTLTYESSLNVLKEAKKAIQLLRPKKIIPIHYNTFDIIKQDVDENLVKESNSKLFIMKPGQQITL